MPQTADVSRPAGVLVERDVRIRSARARAGQGHFLPDHVAWWRPSSHPSSWCRLVGTATTPQVLTSPDICAIGERHRPPVRELVLTQEAQALLPEELARRLARRNPLMRIATPSVWEAAATAVIRQVVHRNHARVVFGRVSAELGAFALVGGQVRHAFPTGSQVLDVTESRL